MRIIKIWILVLCMFLNGCASHTSPKSQENTNSTTTNIELSNNFYALIDIDSNRLVINKFSTFKPKQKKDNGLWVNLSNMSLVWERANTKCIRGIWESHKYKSCSYYDQYPFFDVNIDTEELTNRAIGAIFTFGTSLTASHSFVKFNRKSFTDTFYSNLSVTEINNLKSIDSYMDSLLKTSYKNEKEYSDAINNAYETINLNIIDKSELYSGDNISLRKLLVFESSYPTTKFKITGNSINEVANKLYDSMVFLEKEWDKPLYAYLHCTEKNIKNVNYSLDCPSELTINDGKVLGDITLFVNSINYNNIFIKEYVGSDDNLTLELKNEKIILTNKTTEYIKIQNISIYYNNRIATKKGVEIEIPPNGKLSEYQSFHIQDFDIDWSILSMENVTKNDLVNHALEYGFAIKYKITKSDTEHTYYSTSKYPIWDIFNNKA